MQPAFKPVGTGLQIFGLITLPLEIVTYAFPVGVSLKG